MEIMMKKVLIRFIITAVTAILITAPISAKEVKVTSPDKRTEVTVNVGKAITYSILKDGRTVLLPSELSMTLQDGLVLGREAKLKNDKIKAINEILKPVVKQKYASIEDKCNELTLNFAGNYSVVFRVYNDGVAYRFVTGFDKEVTVYDEKVELNFDKDYKTFFPEEESFHTHSERMYKNINMSEIGSKFCSLPMIVVLDDNRKVAVTEADLEDYAGMYATGKKDSKQALEMIFPKYPKKDTVRSDRDLFVKERFDYIAKTIGKRSFPWRVLVISEKDGDLIESTMIYKLAKPADKKIDFSWVKPGKVAWDWWNSNNIYGVDFKSGVNTETYKYYIDFASKYGIEYIILDEGWYKLGNLLDVVPGMNIEELVAYGSKKNVGIILWVSWKTLNDQLTPALDQFAKWGAKGIKVDFMQRDDQWMVDYYYKIANEAAKRKFLVDFHGAYKPTGLYRTYPNVITNEGVKGLENDKWGDEASPENALVIPFARMLAGPVDYTPGAMVNANKRNFKPLYNIPMSQGTRCQQLAMYVVYESPLQMLADNPTNYYREPECMDFLSKVPAVWDDTKVLDAQVSDYIYVARKSGVKWFVGGMTDWTAREMILDFSFLPQGSYKITIWQDGVNADKNANDFKVLKGNITNRDKQRIKLAPGGGFTAIIENI
jgi:alpha-glucosidase